MISDTLQIQYPRFVRMVKQPPERLKTGKAAVLEFRQGQRVVAKRFEGPKGSENLQMYLDDPALKRPCPEQGPCRRLWLLEDLSKSYIEILGSRLRIPPAFFAAHWADPSGVEFNSRDPFVVNPRERFLLMY